MSLHTPVQPRTDVRTHVPRAGRSVRPANLEPHELRRVLASDPGRRRSGLRGVLELPLLLGVALGLAFLIKTFLVQAFFIPSESMVATLQIGDRVLVEKVTYRLRDPERGEVMVFRRPGAEATQESPIRSFFEGLGLVQPDDDIDLIKRLIALPGETVEVKAGTVFVDGVALVEPYVAQDLRDHPAEVVPDGQLFFLGDNRPNSDDSRFGLGTVPIENVVGRAFVILWPPTNFDLFLDHDYPAAGER